jgi:hypothetical protein
LTGSGRTGTFDIRETIRTDDGATIFVQYHGRLDASQGLQFPMGAYVAPRFETGDERFASLNRITETMDTCGHLFPDSEDYGRGAVEAAVGLPCWPA